MSFDDDLDSPDGSFYVDLGACPRCARPHGDVCFRPLRVPVCDPDAPGRVLFRYWARCFSTDEPVFLKDEGVHREAYDERRERAGGGPGHSQAGA